MATSQASPPPVTETSTPQFSEATAQNNRNPRSTRPSKQPTVPKGILKRPKATPFKTADLDDSIVSRAAAEQTALTHARILEDKKRQESHVLDCIIRLTDLPGSVPFPPPPSSLYRRSRPRSASTAPDAANPTPADAAEFKSLVRTFQPSDYESLVEERNLSDRCGYALCPLRRRHFPRQGDWKLHHGQIVSRSELEKWCSEACARRAMYVAVQLSETAAWEREGIPSITIDLMDEPGDGVGGGKLDRTAEEMTDAQMASLELDEKRRAAQNSEALAAERGVGSMRAKLGASSIKITDKVVTTTPVAPLLPGVWDSEDIHMMIEGHRVKPPAPLER